MLSSGTAVINANLRRREDNPKQHKKNHLSADTVQWFDCDKCESNTKWSGLLKRHTKLIHLSADAIQWFSCEKCEFETKRKDHLKQHKKVMCQ
jgi:hypothetical protein